MEYTNLKAWQMDNLLKNKEISSKELLEKHINKINEIDDKIHAFISIQNENALKLATKIDELRIKGVTLPEYSGIPLAVKDNINIKNTYTTCGSRMLEDYKSPFDASIVKKLNDSNLIILGKANMDEFAMGSSTKYSYFGPSKNPLDITKVPGGSSGGSAASVAAKEVPLSIGTDTGGSVRQPASFCGIVGIKPTYGTVSRYGIVSMANTFDSVGTFGRDVRDAFTLMRIISGVDKMDSTSVRNESYLQDLNYEDEAVISFLNGLKIAIPKLYLDNELNLHVKEEFNRAIKLLESNGAIIEYVDMPDLKYSIQVYHILVNSEVSSNLSRFDGFRYGYRSDLYNNIEDMYKKSRSEGFGDEVKRRIMIGTHILSHDQIDGYYKKALKVRTLIKNEFEEIFKNFDVIVSPTTPVPPFGLNEKMSAVESYMADLFTVPVNIAGNSAISIPLNLKDNISVGIQFIADRFMDIKAIKAGLALERLEKNEH